MLMSSWEVVWLQGSHEPGVSKHESNVKGEATLSKPYSVSAPYKGLRLRFRGDVNVQCNA